MLALGMATLLLCAKSRFIGCGYLCPAGYTQIHLGPSLYAAQIGGLPLVFGMTAVAGILQTAMAPLLRRRPFFFSPPPTVRLTAPAPPSPASHSPRSHPTRAP